MPFEKANGHIKGPSVLIAAAKSESLAGEMETQGLNQIQNHSTPKLNWLVEPPRTLSGLTYV